MLTLQYKYLQLHTLLPNNEMLLQNKYYYHNIKYDVMKQVLQTHCEILCDLQNKKWIQKQYNVQNKYVTITLTYIKIYTCLTT